MPKALFLCTLFILICCHEKIFAAAAEGAGTAPIAIEKIGQMLRREILFGVVVADGLLRTTDFESVPFLLTDQALNLIKNAAILDPNDKADIFALLTRGIIVSDDWDRSGYLGLQTDDLFVRGLSLEFLYSSLAAKVIVGEIVEKQWFFNGKAL